MSSNLEYYKVFYYAGELGRHHAGGGKTVHSQPAVSQAIRQLELSVNAKLFIRTSKGVRLTRGGASVFLCEIRFRSHLVWREYVKAYAGSGYGGGQNRSQRYDTPVLSLAVSGTFS